MSKGANGMESPSVGSVGGDDEQTRGVSRRTALRAGVAVGVGAAAWSGLSITSLGGTPAYAAGCTGVINIDLGDEDCRNTSSDCPGSSYGWHPLKTDPTPAGYPAGSFHIGSAAYPNLGENECCAPGRFVEFTFPDTLQCTVFIDFYANSGDCNKGTNFRYQRTLIGSAEGPSLLIDFNCIAGRIPSTQYNVFALCNSVDAPPECITNPS